MATISELNFKFLREIKNNNNRNWFAQNKSVYQQHQDLLVSFAEKMMVRLNEHDKIEYRSGKKTVIRVYRDIRFSKDKSPYKTYSGMGFRRSTQLLRGSYYIHLEPSKSFVGGGFWEPSKEDLLKIRKGIESDESEFRKIVSSQEFVSVFGKLKGKQLKTCPKGFSKDSTAIDLLRFKQYILTKEFSDDDVISYDFFDRAHEVFKSMRPFLDFMSYLLTTDENGVPLYE
ncbi:MAG: TIGR02453 family protein [Flavobacteriales bacterium]|nr:TIGR02453 family protein [Flavobacteriales bacterium]|tara:strand:+ start:16 stop:702 length:687 start_codon:yes stop_codon:yes gene_type:complete